MSQQKEEIDVLESMYNESDDYQIEYEWSTLLDNTMEPIEFVCEDIVHMKQNKLRLLFINCNSLQVSSLVNKMVKKNIEK